jgi:hypothetical protein
MAIEAADGMAVLLVGLAVPLILLGGRLFRGTQSIAARTVAVVAGIFGAMLLALIVPVLAAKLIDAAARSVWRWLHSSCCVAATG